jgi:hypothetical protein
LARVFRVLFVSLSLAWLLTASNSFAQLQTPGLHTGINDLRGGVVEAGGWVWIVAGDSLYRWRLGSPEKPERVELNTKFFSSSDIWEVDGWVWIKPAGQSLYRCRVRSLGELERVELNVSDVHSIQEVAGWVWINADTGRDPRLYRYRVGSLDNPVLVEPTIHVATDILEVGGWVWIAQELGYPRLFRCRVGSSGLFEPVKLTLSREMDTPDDSRVSEIQEVGGWLWIGTERGLYRWRLGSPGDPQWVGTNTKYVKKIWVAGGWQWIDGDLRWRAGFPGKPERLPDGIRDVSAIQEVGGWVWIEAGLSLYRCRVGSSDMPEPVRFKGEFHHVSGVREAGEWLWIGTERGLYRWRLGSLGDPELVEPYTGNVSGIQKVGEWLWIGTDRGLYRWRVGSPPTPELVELNAGDVSGIQVVGGCLWLWTRRGLLQIPIATEGWNTNIHLTKRFPNISYTDTPLPISWEIENYGRRTAPEIVRCRVLVFKGQDTDPSNVWEVPRGRFDFALPESLPAGNYRIVVEATDLWGKVARSERPLEFHVYASILEVIGYWLARILVSYLLMSMLAFLGLLMASHRSGRALQFLTSPWVLRLGVCYGWALRKLPPLQVWVLGRYFHSARLDLEEPTHPHVPRLLARPPTTGILSTDLLNELRSERRIWITGGPGTGKTDTVGEVLRGYFAHATSAWSGWRQYRFIPVAIRLRDTIRVSLDQILIEELSRLGVSFGDEHFASGFIHWAPLLIILDGVNEARLNHRELETWLPDFLKTAPRARILATSQTDSGSESLVRYEMPPITGEFARKLLCAFLDESAGTAVYAATPPDLWDGPEELTAYEVRQIADLARRGQPVPSTRTELYLATLKASTEGIDRPEDVLGPLSLLAWAAWLEGWWSRFSAPAGLSEPIPANVVGPILVRRGVQAGEERYEFVHELMRAYLAARWAVVYVKPPVACLYGEKVWRSNPSRSSQSFFTFLAELIQDPEELEDVAQFAMDTPGLRVGLLDAALQVAGRREWVLHLSTVPEREEYLQALSCLTKGELDHVILALGLNVDNLPDDTPRARANAVFVCCNRRPNRLPELRERIRPFYPGAPLFERYPPPSG